MEELREMDVNYTMTSVKNILLNRETISNSLRKKDNNLETRDWCFTASIIEGLRSENRFYSTPHRKD